MAGEYGQNPPPLERWLAANRESPNLDASLRLLLGHAFWGIFRRTNPEFSVFSPEKAISLVQRLPAGVFPDSVGEWLANPQRNAVEIVRFCENSKDFELPGNLDLSGFLTGRVDLRGVHCPTASVRARLVLSGMSAGEEVTLLVDDAEPIENVPRAMLEDGNRVVSREKKGNYWVLKVRKQDFTV